MENDNNNAAATISASKNKIKKNVSVSFEENYILKIKNPTFIPQPNFDLVLNENNPYKIILLGSSNVGKTTYINSLLYNVFIESKQATISLDYKIVYVEIKRKDRVDEVFNQHNYSSNVFYFKLSIWDTAGQERYRAIQSHYLRKSDGVIILFDVSDDATIVDMKYWYDLCMQEYQKQKLNDDNNNSNDNNIIRNRNKNKSTIVKFIGNKIDLQQSNHLYEISLNHSGGNSSSTVNNNNNNNNHMLSNTKSNVNKIINKLCSTEYYHVSNNQIDFCSAKSSFNVHTSFINFLYDLFENDAILNERLSKLLTFENLREQNNYIKQNNKLSHIFSSRNNNNDDDDELMSLINSSKSTTTTIDNDDDKKEDKTSTIYNKRCYC